MSRLDEIRTRLSAATPGPWEVSIDGDDIYGIYAGRVRIVETDAGFYPPRKPDAHLIANAPSDISWLLEENERLRGALEHLGDSEQRECCDAAYNEDRLMSHQAAVASAALEGASNE